MRLEEKEWDLKETCMICIIQVKPGFPFFYLPPEKRSGLKIEALLIFHYLGFMRNISKTRTSCFIRGSKHQETDESTRPQAEYFYCLKVFETPDKTRSTSF